LKLRDIADRLQCSLEGDGDVDIVRVAAVHKAGPGDLTFVASARYLPKLATTRASAVILARATAADSRMSCAVLRTDDPYSAFANAVTLFAPHGRPAPGVDPMSAVARDASIGVDASIGAFVTSARRGDRRAHDRASERRDRCGAPGSATTASSTHRSRFAIASSSGIASPFTTAR
jgi:UDP-3-O-[3-hydroxymyristoyl] glucosamine N-acyltransferase